ncbi:ABC transporter substrate-binding protein [Alkalihalobacillus trypoxylicola]|uniref:ABC transporter substrate-binding protein n=2 Tax=Alkalihalobacillus trypoxylicola TaxID=519424 RepID=A0A162CXV6_9BACI|nr:ABC transporter substrate-binding protein [Alkalihalobacillus trypoxylicola]
MIDGIDSGYQHSGLSKYESTIDLNLVRNTSKNLTNLLKEFPGDTLSDNRWTRLYKDTLGINIQYNWIAEDNLYHQKLGVDIVSRNFPDVMKVNTQQLRELANAGLIQDLNDVYETYMTPFTKEVMYQEGIDPFEVVRMDQKLMGIPVLESSVEAVQYIWIRTDWLEQLGMSPPETMDDLLEISKAFTFEDPDQNGVDDTYGLAVTQYIWDPAMGLSGFMAGFNSYPNLWLENEEGKLVYGGIQSEVKDALLALQTMYQSGEIDEEFMFKDGNQVSEQIKDGTIGLLYGEQWASFLVADSVKNNNKAEWGVFPIVTNEEDKLARVPIQRKMNEYWVVRKGYEHPEAIMKMINLHLEMNWGESAEYENYYSTPYPVWQLSPVTPFPPLKNLDAYLQIDNAVANNQISNLKGEAKAIYEKMDSYHSQNDFNGWGWALTYGSDGAFSVLNEYIENEQILLDKYVGILSDSMGERKTILEHKKLDTYINIILGSPIETFDDFVQDWEKMGGEEITKEINDFYQQLNSSY